MKNIAIIPARSGSKGLPDKNIRLLCGKPLLAYSIEAALQSDIFDVVHVSTDSIQYAEIAKKFGADVPFLRSTETSSDSASSWDVVKEVIEKYQKVGKCFDTFMLLQPTSPLRTSEDIRNAYKLMNDKKANAIVAVCEADHPPQFYNVLQADGSLKDFLHDEVNDKRRQDMGTYYRINGAVYLAKTSYFLRNSNIYRDACYAYVMEKNRSVDIDSLFDFQCAEFLLTNL